MAAVTVRLAIVRTKAHVVADSRTSSPHEIATMRARSRRTSRRRDAPPRAGLVAPEPTASRKSARSRADAGRFAASLSRQLSRTPTSPAGNPAPHGRAAQDLPKNRCHAVGGRLALERMPARQHLDTTTTEREDIRP